MTERGILAEHDDRTLPREGHGVQRNLHALVTGALFLSSLSFLSCWFCAHLSLAPPSRCQPAHTFSWPFTYLFRQDLAAPPSDVSMMPLSQQRWRKYGRVWYNALTCAPSQTHVCCVPVGLLMFVVYCWRADQVLFRYRYVEPIRHRADAAACGLCDARDRERRRAEQQQANAKVPMPMTR